MKRIITISLLSLLILPEVLAQDPQFSQFYTANLYLAPSFAGATKGGKAAVVYRNQWPEINHEFNTYLVSLDHYFPGYHCGVGFYMLQDVAGAAKFSSASYQLQYSYLFRATNSIHVRPGIQLGYIHKGLNGRLLFGDQLSFEGNKPISNETDRIEGVHLFDYSTSMLMYTENIWLGGGLDHMPFANQSFLGSENLSPMKISVYGGFRMVVHDRLLLREQNYLSFSFIYKKQNQYQQLDIGMYYTKFPVEVGFWYRGLPVVKNPYGYLNQDALISKIGIKFEEFSVGYSYDFTFSKLRSYSGGAHEISISWLFNQDQKPDKKKFKAVPCPGL